MNLENIFTAEELALIDSGNYKPGRAVLDAKLDLVAAMEREACAKVAADFLTSGRSPLGRSVAAAIRAKGQA